MVATTLLHHYLTLIVTKHIEIVPLQTQILNIFVFILVVRSQGPVHRLAGWLWIWLSHNILFREASLTGGLPGAPCVVLEPAGASDGALHRHGVPAGQDVDEESTVLVLQLVFSIHFIWGWKIISFDA